jgi:hypothetical protein
MLEAIKSLVDSGIINESTRDAINEAWEEKLAESKEQVRAELREEFAGRYEHDKSVMVETIDKMVTESLTQELKEFTEDKAALAADRVAFKKQMKEAAKKMEQFVSRKLAEEIAEFRGDRKVQTEATKRLEKFVIQQLAEEITEFSQDKQAVVETKVKLVSEAKAKMAEIEKKFVKKAARLVKESITSTLDSEMTQLKEDITSARENMFGRKIFEAFASEFTLTHLNENKEVAKLRDAVSKRDAVIAESRKGAAESKKLIESKEKEIKIIQETNARTKKIDKLVSTLNKDKASTMRELLESVQTHRLNGAFEKYLPAVLNNGSVKKAKQPLKESRKEVTGNKTTAKQTNEVGTGDVVDIKRLAGL